MGKQEDAYKKYTNIPDREYYNDHFPWKTKGIEWPSDLKFAPPLRERHYSDPPVFCLRCLLDRDQRIVQKSERTVYPGKFICPIHGWHSFSTAFFGYDDLLHVYRSYLLDGSDYMFIFEYLVKKLNNLKDY